MQNSSKGNNSWKNHRTRTRRWYAHPPSILNIPMKFQWNPTSSFREFAWTRTVPYIFMQNSSKGNNSWKNHRTRTRRWYAHPPLILNIPMKFHWNPTSSSKGNNSWKNHRTKTRRWYAHPPSILNIPMKFQWNPTSSFREFAWTRTVPYIFMQNSSKGNNSWKNHRTRTRRWYAHPPLILNIPMKFHWNPTSSFREFAWTRAGRTHGRTDARTKWRLYAPPKFFGEHKYKLASVYHYI